VVLCAGQPDTPDIAAEMEAAVAEARAHRSDIVWIPEMVSRSDVRQLYSHAGLFVCPSVYEPFGIINLEAMACETAVVASAVGGIPEVVDDGRTGLLVPYDAERPADFAAGLAARISDLLADPARAAAMGVAGRERVLAEFGWPAIAEQTVQVYRTVLGAGA